MLVPIVLGAFWVIYGILGFFGVQRVPERCKGKSWTESYMRSCGVAYILLGLPWLVFGLVTYNMKLHFPVGGLGLAMVILAIPSVIYGLVIDRKYKPLMNSDQE